MEWLKRLKQMKSDANMTTRAIAEGSGVPEPTLEKLFSGATKEPKLDTMRQLVHFLGYTLDDLAPLRGQKEKPIDLTHHETNVINAYRARPDMQPAVDTLLGLPRDEEPVYRLPVAAYGGDGVQVHTVTKSQMADAEKIYQDLKSRK